MAKRATCDARRRPDNAGRGAAQREDAADDGTRKRRGAADSAARWLTRADACDVFGISSTWFDEHVRRRLPADAKREDVRPMRFDGRAIHVLLCAEKMDKARRDVTDDDAEIMRGKDSPHLERWRLAKAKREEFLLARDLGQWVSADDVRAGLGVIVAHVRRGAEALQRQYGREAHAILDEALDAAQEECRRKFSAVLDDHADVADDE